MRITGVEAAIAHYREAGTKTDAHNRNCAQMGSAQLGVLLYVICQKFFCIFFSVLCPKLARRDLGAPLRKKKPITYNLFIKK